MIGRAEQFCGLGVVDDRADLAAEEVAQILVRLAVHEDVVERAERGEQITGRPGLFESLLPALVGDGERTLLAENDRDSRTRVSRLLAVLGPSPFDRGELLGGDRSVVRRRREVRRALEDGEFGGLLGDQRNRLDTGRARADDADALAGEIDPAVRPCAREVDGTPEVGGTLDLGTLGDREAPRRHHVVAARDLFARAQFDAPHRRALVPSGALDARGELDVSAQVMPVGDMVQVLEDLGLCRVLLGPLPLLVEFGIEAVGVVDALDVAARTGVAVPVPRASDVVGRLEDAERKAEFSEAMDRIEAGEARADHHHVEIRFTRYRH